MKLYFIRYFVPWRRNTPPRYYTMAFYNEESRRRIYDSIPDLYKWHVKQWEEVREL